MKEKEKEALYEQMDELPLSQDIDVYDVFMSTQAQSRFDDLEEEVDRLKKARQLTQEFTHTTKEPVKPKRASAKKKKEKKKKKVKSITDHMISKLSGKPGKLYRMKLNMNLNDLPDDNFSVFTNKEWSKMNDLLKSSIKRSGSSIKRDTPVDSHEDDNWWMGDGEPSGLQSDDMGLLYEHDTSNAHDYGEMDSPITLSQVVKEVYDREHLVQEIIEIDSQSEIECSEDEGEILFQVDKRS